MSKHQETSHTNCQRERWMMPSHLHPLTRANLAPDSRDVTLDPSRPWPIEKHSRVMTLGLVVPPFQTVVSMSTKTSVPPSPPLTLPLTLPVCCLHPSTLPLRSILLRPGTRTDDDRRHRNHETEADTEAPLPAPYRNKLVPSPPLSHQQYMRFQRFDFKSRDDSR